MTKLTDKELLNLVESWILAKTFFYLKDNDFIPCGGWLKIECDLCETITKAGCPSMITVENFLDKVFSDDEN